MSWKVRANDGIDPAGQALLEKAGCEVLTDHLSPEELMAEAHELDALLVRSATQVRQDLINNCSKLKVIGRGGVGLDNIDVKYAESKGVAVVNTPAASSASVAELVFGHMFGMVRGLQKTNRIMPERGDSEFKALKKACSKGTELSGKTLGVIGAGRIGRETARLAVGCGMNVLFSDPFVDEVELKLSFHPDVLVKPITLHFKTVSKEELLRNSDFVSLHIPGGGEVVMGEAEFDMMKDGSGIVNCARGGVVSEKALLSALNSGKIAYAGVDVFESEPPVDMSLLQHDNVSLSPHIGAATREAQERVGVELAEKVIERLHSVSAQ